MKACKAFFATSSLCTGLMLAAVAAPASAQGTSANGQPAQTSQPGQPGAAPVTQQTQQQAQGQTSTATTGALVVTGSRIKTTTFNSPAPLTTITAEQAQLTGQVDTSQILQLSPVAANAVQINNFFTGFITAGGPGVNTLSLRGLGSNRTLILLNGERLGPAGVSGTVSAIDLNTIPSSMIDHIEILKDGASSVYGSDAVAGVVNIITKTNTDGGDLHLFANPSQGGGGNTYQADISYGKTFAKGYVQAGFDYYRQDPLRLNQRDYLDCSQDLARFQGTGAIADIIDPATGKSKCWNEIANAVEDLGQTFVVFRPNPAAVGGGGPFGTDVPGWQNVGLDFRPPFTPFTDNAATRASHALEPENTPLFGQNTAISPVSRYTFTLFAGYDLTPHAQIYGSVLLNQRDSEQFLVDQFFIEPVTFPGQIPDNPGFVYPVPIIQQAAPATQTVNYGRFVLGVKGDLPEMSFLHNWTYDIFGQYSRSDGSYTQVYQKADRVSATGGSGIADNSCDVNNSDFSPGSMAQLEPGVACVPVNYFRAAATGQFTPQEMAFLYSNARGHTTYDQAYAEGNFSGDLFQLPAGPLGAAVGFHVRRESIDDTPPPDFQIGNAYNFSSAGITKGAYEVEEGYGEVKIPIIKDFPGIYDLNVDVSGRYSNYSDFGGQFTYKGTVDWKITDWLAARGTYGTAFRAPALFELFLANQTGFLGQIQIDPCIDYGTSGVSPTIAKNCAAQGIPPNYAGISSSAEILSGGGAGHLSAETSIAETIGFVLTPQFGDRSINLAVDYYSFDIDNQIAQFGATNIVNACYASPSFPNSPFCSLFHRDLNAGPNQFQIVTVNDDFVNLNKQLFQGIDVTLNYRTQLPWETKLTVDAELDWTLYNNTFLLQGTTNNFLGSLGFPRFVGNVNWKFDRGPWTFNWELYMIGHQSDNPFSATTITHYRGSTDTVTTDYVTPFYTLSNVSIRRKFDKFDVIVGVRNIFDQAPPSISFADAFEPARIGNTPSLISQFDLIGRSFYFNLDARF